MTSSGPGRLCDLALAGCYEMAARTRSGNVSTTPPAYRSLLNWAVSGERRSEGSGDPRAEQPAGQRWYRDPVPAAYSVTIELAYTRPSIVAGFSRAVIPLSPGTWVCHRRPVGRRR
jgi:hypothetical protein